MNSQWKSPLSQKIWQKMKLDAKNNKKTSLGLISLMINLENEPELDLVKQDDGMSM